MQAVNMCTHTRAHTHAHTHTPGSFQPLSRPHRYDPIRVIGSGYHAKVWLAIDVIDGKCAAIKAVEKPSPYRTGALDGERYIMEQLSHPSILALLGYGAFPCGMEFLVFEYMPHGDWFDNIVREENNVDT